MTSAAIDNKSQAGGRYLYLFTLFFLTLSGFGQMPIFKRYYIADIPGLGWLAQFYVTHYIHYLGAILLLGLCAFYVTQYLMIDQKQRQLTFTGYFNTVLLVGLIVTGLLLVVKNFTFFHFPNALIIILDLMHLSLVMLLIAHGVYSLITKKRWTMSRTH